MTVEINRALQNMGWQHQKVEISGGNISIPSFKNESYKKLSHIRADRLIWEKVTSVWEIVAKKIHENLLLKILLHLFVPAAFAFYLIRGINNLLDNNFKKDLKRLSINKTLSPVVYSELSRLVGRPKLMEQRLQILIKRKRGEDKLSEESAEKLMKLTQEHAFHQVLTELSKEAGTIDDLKAYMFYVEKKLMLEKLASQLKKVDKASIDQATRKKIADLHKSYEHLLNLTNDPDLVGEFRVLWEEINDSLGVSHKTCGCTRQTETFEITDAPITINGRSGEARKPKVSVFLCNVGSGHKMASLGIAQSLPDCHVQITDTYNTILPDLDLGRKINPALGCEAFPNNLAKKELNTLLNIGGYLIPPLMMLQQKEYEKRITDYVKRERPDILISTIPLLNPAFLNVAKKFDIPLIVATTDIGITHFTNEFTSKRCDLSYEKFAMTVPFTKQSAGVKKADPALIKKMRFNFGYPLRRNFSTEIKEETLNQIRKEYEIQDDEDVILIMGGGNAAQAAKKYVKMILEMDDKLLDTITDKKLRLICLSGNTKIPENRRFMDRLNALNKKNHRVTIKAVPNTPKIAQLVSLPEMKTVISKPGGGTVNEMIRKKMPMIYHTSRGTPIRWEVPNMEFGIKKDFGVKFSVFKGKQALAKALQKTFTRHHEMRTESVPEAEIDFTKNLRTLARNMLKGQSKRFVHVACSL